MAIHTSYFGNIKTIKQLRPNEVFISIAGYAPKWFDGYKFPELAPKKWWWKIWHETFKNNLESEESKSWYSEKYRETVLNHLDLETVSKKFDSVSRSGFGSSNLTLLCYETPEKFCHRHLLAEWINKHIINETRVTSRLVVEWRDNKCLDITIARTLLKNIGLELKEVIGYPGNWYITRPKFSASLFCGDANYIFEELQCERWFKTAAFSVKNPYYGKSYEELLIRANLLNPNLLTGC